MSFDLGLLFDLVAHGNRLKECFTLIEKNTVRVLIKTNDRGIEGTLSIVIPVCYYEDMTLS